MSADLPATRKRAVMADQVIQQKALQFASFLRDIVEATTTRQIDLTQQTQEGFVIKCQDLPQVPEITSEYVDNPGHGTSEVLSVARPGKQPKPPKPDENGVVTSEAEAEHQHQLREWRAHAGLYDDLFENRVTPDNLELVFAVGLLRTSDNGNQYVRHLAVAPAEITLDSTDGTVAVHLIDSFKREVNWLPGDVRAEIVGTIQPLDDLINSDTFDEASEALEQLATTLGRNAFFDDDTNGSTANGERRLAVRPCVLLRRRDSSALQQLLETMCDDIKEGGDLSEPFKTLVDPTYIAPALESSVDVTVLPLDANATQRAVIERARTERHLVIQGPPGTGKTHTIANLLSSLMAEGRRVLVTAETDRALAEVQDKLPEGMRSLALPLLGDRQNAGLQKSVNGILDRTGRSTFKMDLESGLIGWATQLEQCKNDILTAEQALIRSADIDREEHQAGGQQLTLGGHQKYLSSQSDDLQLVDTFLSPQGTVSQAEIDEYRQLISEVNDHDRELQKMTFPNNVHSGVEFEQFITEFQRALAQIPESDGRPYADLEDLTDELGELARLLDRTGNISWFEISRTAAEYLAAQSDAIRVSSNLDNGVTTLRGATPNKGIRLLNEFLDNTTLQLSSTIPNAIRLYEQAEQAANEQHNPIQIDGGSKLSELFRQADDAAALLEQDTTGLLGEHATNRLKGAQGRIPQLCQEAKDLQEGLTLRPGLPVTYDSSIAPIHELLHQAAQLKVYIDGGGSFTRKLIVPKAVKSAEVFLRTVKVGESDVDTPEELDRSIEFLRYEQQVQVVRSWAQQNHLSARDETNLSAWLESFSLLDSQAAQLTATITELKAAVGMSLGTAAVSPRDLINGVRKALGTEIVQRLSAFKEAFSELNDEIRSAGIPVESEPQARAALAALSARLTRLEFAEMLPENWRAQIDPQSAEPDRLSEMLFACAHASKVPAWARDSQLSASSTRDLIGRIQADARRIDILARHDDTIRKLTSEIIGCVPKSPGVLLLEEAVADEAPTKYSHAIEVIDNERSRAQKASRCSALEKHLLAQHPNILSGLNAGVSQADDVANRLEYLQQIRDHRSQVEDLYQGVREVEEIHRNLSELYLEQRKIEQKISENRCWLKLVERLENRRELKSSLSALTNAMSKVPKTRSAKSYGRRMKALKDATESAAPAVPCWIMPISRAVELVGYPTPEERFDVVIIDEASQAWFTAGFLYALAEQVIVVGDDLQTSPADQVMKDADIRSVVQQWIPQHRIGNVVGPDLSLYDIAVTMTGPETMVDHFRCVPEIIGISNQLSYEPNQKTLLPARVRSGDSPEPVVHHRCDGIRVGNDPNHEEVNRLVETALACHADPANHGKTFGVVVAASSPNAHIKAIQHELLDVLGPAAIQQRQFDVGTAATFQGAERDVMFLSLVDSATPGEMLIRKPKEYNGRNRLYVQQLNVAVSRAKDQLHIFHSFDLDNLKDGDARQDLFRLPSASQHLLEDEVEKCQSQFEKDVILALHDADPSLRIYTQVEALGYSIDIVLEDENGHQLAVECDGDRWHTADEDMRRDLYRQRALERIGWRFERFLSSQWYADPSRITSQILDAMRTKAAPPRRAYDRQRSPSAKATPTRDSGSTPETDTAAERQVGSTDTTVDPRRPHDPDQGQRNPSEPESATEEIVVETTERPVTRLPEQNDDATPPSGTSARSSRPRLSVKTTELPPPTTPAATGQQSPETAKERNRALAQALRDRGKETGGEVWHRAKKYLADGDSIEEAARRA